MCRGYGYCILIDYARWRASVAAKINVAREMGRVCEAARLIRHAGERSPHMAREMQRVTRWFAEPYRVTAICHGP